MCYHRFTFPEPIPASHTFFLSELDSKDGFIHLSTARQVPKTLGRFFANVESVTLLRIELDRLAAFKRVKWEGSGDDSESSADHAHDWPGRSPYSLRRSRLRGKPADLR